MLEVKIIISLPNTKESKYKLTMFNSTYKRNNLISIYGLLERNLDRKLASYHNTKTSVLVKYDNIYSNESEKSNDKNYLLKMTAQFLEDYLDKEYVRGKELKYGYK